MVKRCAWAGNDEDMIAYHDDEWGVPCTDEHKLFEMLILEGAQAGLSWMTILKRRGYYREAFARFDPEVVAGFGEDQMEALLQNTGIIRNKLKIRAAVNNAQRFLQVQKAFGTFSDYIWSFVSGHPIINHWQRHEEVPAKTSESEQMSKDLKKRGFKFVGPTICYAFMQATGMVNDHTVDCFRHAASE